MSIQDEETPHQPATSIARPNLLDVSRAQPSISIIAHEITLDGSITQRDVDDVLVSVNNLQSGAPENTFWLDAELQMDTACEKSKEKCFAELKKKILDRLPLPTFLQRHFTYKQLFLPQFLALNKAALMSLRILPVQPLRLGVDAELELSSTAHYAAALCLPHFLLTMTIIPCMNHRQESTFRKLEVDTISYISEHELPQASSTGTLSIWLLYHLNQVSLRAHSLRLKVYELDDKIGKDAASVELSTIMSVKDTFLHMISIAEEQRECIQSLLEGEKATGAIDFKPFSGFRGLILSTSSSTERMLSRMEKRITDIRQTYDAHQQDRINRRLATLTILSAVFLPLTLMAGIWGMNFTNMPELERENAYYFALASMVTVAFLSLSVFHLFGWL